MGSLIDCNPDKLIHGGGRMNAGLQTIEWLYSEQLRIDAEWAVRNSKGFQWWPASNAQTIEIVGEEVGPDGDKAQLISIHTELLRDLECDESALSEISATLMPFASMSGPVYDPKRKSLDLRALVRVHEGNHKWVRALISMVAVTQFEEVAKLSEPLAETLRAICGKSQHPTGGSRVFPDELFDVVSDVIVPMGQEPSRWTEFEFQSLAEQFFEQPPCLLGNLGGAGATIEFPYGETSSLCQLVTDQAHPAYGNGLLILQSFPFTAGSHADGIKTALLLNEKELFTDSSGYGMGSFSYRDNTICFTAFMPNSIYQTGLLPDFYAACASRARAVSEFFMDSNWAEEPFGPSRSALGRVIGIK